MKNIVWLALGGVGLYILYEKYVASQNVVGGTPIGTPIQPGTTPNQNTQNPITTISSSQPGSISIPQLVSSQDASVTTFQQYLVQNNLVNDMHNTDEWNWYYTQATGKNGPAPESMGINPRNLTMNASSYSNMINAWLGGKTSINGLGMIIGAPGMATTYGTPSQRLYAAQRGISHRPTAIPTGWELATKKVQ